jgi:3-hydroxyisobutyrate dehydrogenase-like beta-hydroxyacid dehydrogenase
MRIAFIGLGVMGFPMAGHLARAGHDVTVYNRTATKARQWCEEHGGRAARTPALAADGAGIVFTCVGNDDDVRAVTTGDDGVLASIGEGSLLIDHTTASAALARELAAACAAVGAGFIDAPVSGGQSGAEHGTLTVMAGGEAGHYAAAEPVIDIYARRCRLMGPAGAGQLTKMVNQVSIAGLLQGLAEGLHFAERAGLDGRAVVEAISQGAAQSWQMDNRHETMIDGEFDFGFAVEWMRKDLAIALDEARRNGASLPVAALVDQFYADVEAMGGRRWDTSSLIVRLTAPSAQRRTINHDLPED